MRGADRERLLWLLPGAIAGYVLALFVADGVSSHIVGALIGVAIAWVVHALLRGAHDPSR
jgi:uncharacterized membrane protein YfcA